MTRQELADLLEETWCQTTTPSPPTAWMRMADAVIAAGFPVDPEPVTVQLPRAVAEWYATGGKGTPATYAPSGRVTAACREALGMEPCPCV